MIEFFHGQDRDRHAREADGMFRLRARQFRDRLGWAVDVRHGREVDTYDAMNPLYLVSRGETTGEVAGSLRFLPTTGPTMLRDVFNPYFDEPFEVESPLVWECTRFAIEPALAAARMTPTGLCRTTFELMQGGCEVALLAGVEQILAVFDHHMIRIYRRAGWGPEIIARSDKPATGTIYLGLWDVSERSLASMRERSGMTESVIRGTAKPDLPAVA